MNKYVFWDAGGNSHPFPSLEEATNFAEKCGYVFAFSRKLEEGKAERISYYLRASDLPSKNCSEQEKIDLILQNYAEWKEPRIEPLS